MVEGPKFYYGAPEGIQPEPTVTPPPAEQGGAADAESTAADTIIPGPTEAPGTVPEAASDAPDTTDTIVGQPTTEHTPLWSDDNGFEEVSRELYHRSRTANLDTDAAQDAVLAIWLKGAAEFTSIGAAFNYVRRVARNREVSVWRKHGRREVPIEEETGPLRTLFTRSLESGTDVAKLVTDRIVAIDALKSVSHRNREIVFLVDVMGYTPMDAAVELGINANSLRVWLMKGRREFRAQLYASTDLE